MKNFLTKNIELQDKKIWKTIAIGIIYFSSIILLLKVGKYFLELPLLLAKEYNISVNEMNVLYGGKYILGTIAIMIIAVLTLPVYMGLNRLKKGSRDGVEFFSDEEVQSAADVLENDSDKISNKIKKIVQTDDNKTDDEEEEKKIFSEEIGKDLLKCKRIKDRMLPLTMEVTRELYIQCRNDITYEKVLRYVRLISKYRRKDAEERSTKIAKSIVDFLNKSGIIESDEGFEDKYYFTILGKSYMNYFMNGII